VAQTENGDTALHLLLSNAAKRTAMEGSFLNRNTTKLAELLVMNNNAPALVHHRRSRTSSSIISPLLVKNKVDLTPLHCCALFDTPAQLTRIVMECSPVAEQASAVTTTFGATPVHLACASSHPDAANIEALATRLACCTRDDKDRTPLVVALQNDKMPSQVIKLLIAVYPQAVDHAVRKGQYLPLHLALMNSSVKESVIRNLLKASPNTIKAVTKSGNTALHIACQQSHPNATIIKLLLDRYREANRIRNKLGQLPIDLVQSKKHYKSLLKKVPGLVPPVVVSSSSGGDDNNLPLVKSSPSKTLSPSKLPKTRSTSGSSSSNKISSSSSSSKKKAAILAAAAAAAAASTTTTTTAAAATNTSKSSNSSTVRSSTDDGSHDGYGDDDCDYEDDNISDKVSCLTDPSHF
jgi:ankyrin repeat protein